MVERNSHYFVPVCHKVYFVFLNLFKMTFHGKCIKTSIVDNTTCVFVLIQNDDFFFLKKVPFAANKLTWNSVKV